MSNISSRKTEQPGTLYIVATPIGNRDDISLRAIQTLKSVDKILAEDTRHTKPLLSMLGIDTPLLSFHAHNEAERLDEFITLLQQGLSLALVSDAGTPLISDPGFPLVRQARLCAIPVVPIPGACALIAALSASGLPCDRFTFAGFLPAKSIARCKQLESLKHIEHTLIFYESTHRIQECLTDIAKVMGDDCDMVLAKELSKTFETFVSGNCQIIQNWLLEESARCKGEFVLILAPRISPPQTDQYRLLSILLSELPLKQAVKIACEITGEAKNELYELALNINKSG
jgi:16S rRNA (cytidine1402-2'-O)-methyltransferase